MSHRSAALALYRRALCAARTWPSASEVPYIRREARAEAERGRALGGDAAAEALVAAERRLEIAVHYKIPWPRPVNKSFTRVGAVPEH